MRIVFILLLHVLVIIPYSMDRLFYITRAPAQNIEKSQSYASLLEHSRAIDILVAQSYYIDAEGNVLGQIDPEVLALLKHII